MEQKRTVVVERSKWLRSPDYCGPDYVEWLLDKEPSLMNIVEIVRGQLLASAGERLIDAQTRQESEAAKHHTDLPESLVQAAEDINDRDWCRSGNGDYMVMSEAEQEDRLARLFATIGIELKFVY
jgi:hypothetical protein